MPTKFEGVLTDYGFDPSATPPWLMVPVAGFKRIRLLDSANLTVSSTATSIATVAEAPSSKATDAKREFLISGKAKGSAFIEAHRHDKLKGKVQMARLEVAVKTVKTVKVAFNFVEDKAGHKTTRAVADADKWIEELNKIFLPQANLTFTKHAAKFVKVDKDLGKVVRFSKHLRGVAASQHEWDLVTAKGDSTADFNIFLVWEYEQDATPLKDNSGGGTLSGNCIFEDKVDGSTHRNLAHEAGHFLGLGDDYTAANKAWLMYGYETGGTSLTKTHIIKANP